MQITVYKTETEFSFGKHKGKTLREVTETNPDYIDWCISKLPGFVISSETLAELKNINNSFSLSEKSEYMFQFNLELYGKLAISLTVEDWDETTLTIQEDKSLINDIKNMSCEEIDYLIQYNHIKLHSRLNKENLTSDETNLILDDYNMFCEVFKDLKDNPNEIKREHTDDELECFYINSSPYEFWLHNNPF